MTIIMALLGGWISRMCGGGWPKLKWGLDQWLYALPYGLVFLPFAPLASALAFVGAFLGKRTGHGQYHGRAGKVVAKDEQERLDFIVRFFFGEDTGQYWRKQFGLAVTGVAVTLAPGILYAVEVDALTGAFLAVSGASKTLAYMIGYYVHDVVGYKKFVPTAIGEFLTGVMGWGLLACLVV